MSSRDQGYYYQRPIKPIRDMTEQELRELGSRIGNAVKAVTPKGTSFVTLFFDESQIGQYVANCERGPMIQILRETADRLQAREDIPR